MNKFFGIALVVIALAVAVVPAFTDCQSQGKALTTSTGKEIPMKCHWTGIAEIGVAVPMLGIGVMSVASRRKETLRNMGILGVIVGAFVIALPTSLIGVCQTPTMLCHTVMKPALISLGSLAVAGSIGMMLISRKASE